jgi:hypothetical protein
MGKKKTAEEKKIILKKIEEYKNKQNKPKK